MLASYDIFLSHAWADGERPQKICEALRKAGLRVWFDAKEINDFASITHAVTEGLAKSKALVAYYSKSYPLRRACQWELTAAFLAAQTEGDPPRRVLVINPEQGADHIHPIELRDAKFRSAPNNDGELQQLVDSIVKHVAEVRGPLADIHPLSAPNWYGMTPVGSTRFVGRLKEMWEVHSLLRAGDVAQITGAAAAAGGIGQVQGLGGVGKSLLAEEYALHFGAAYPGGVFWVRAYANDDAKVALGAVEREALRADQVRQMAERLGINTQGMTAEQIEGELARKISSEGKDCLWVVDDVPGGLDGQALRRWFAPHALARTLVTTRSREYGSLAKALNLNVLTPDEAYQLLISQRAPASEAEEKQARLLAEELGYHALALDVTGSALVSFGSAEPFREFRAELGRDDKDALELAKDLADALPNGHEASIAKTLLRSIVHLGAEGLDFLRLASVLAVAPIPAPLVIAVFEKTDGLIRSDAKWRASLAFRQVTAASLAEVAGEEGAARSVHTLVSRVVRFRDARLVRTGALRVAAVAALLAEIAKVAPDPRLHKQIEFHLAHARQIVATPKTISEADLVHSVAPYDYERGAYASARTLYERVLEFRRRVLGPEHPDTLTSMSSLAVTLNGQGDLAGACKLGEEVLAIWRRVLGPEHPNTLGSMSNLANTLFAQGDLTGARKLQEETLAIRRRVLGPEHPHTLTSMNNLAGMLAVQGDLAGARKLQEEVLVMRRVLGPEHPDTLRSMNNLANTLNAQGDLAGARKLVEETLEIQRRVLGPEHPNTLISMNNLAENLRALGDLEGARKLLEETLEINRRVLGPQHPQTLTSMSNLAVTIKAQGALAGARKLQEEVLEILRRELGPEHPNTLTSANNLALTLSAQGDLAGARKLLEETLSVDGRLRGTEHPDTLRSRGNLASTLSAQGDLEGARKLQEVTLDTFGGVLGFNHPDTLTAMDGLAETLRAQGDLAGARKLQEETLEILRRVQGPEHPDTLTMMSNLARTLEEQGDLVGARKLQEENLATRRRTLGPEHPQTLTSMNNLATTLSAQGDLAGARKLLEETLSVDGRVLGPEHPQTLTAMNNLASTVYAQRDFAAAREQFERALTIFRRVQGLEHPNTSISAWNLFRALQDLGEREAARVVLERDLLWLLDRDPATLGSMQREIREYVAEAVKTSR